MIQPELFSWVPPPPEALKGDRDGSSYVRKQDLKRLNEQAQAVWDAMSDLRWYSLEELKAKLERLHPEKQFPITSISARQRDFRKNIFGGTHETVETVRVSKGLFRSRLHPEKRLDA